MMSGFASENPFAVLSLVAAPALLTNAASLMALSTANRFLRAGERLRIVIEELKKAELPAEREWRLVHMNRIEKQAMLLLVALRAVYVALGCFVMGSLVAIVGAALAERKYHPVDEVMMGLGLVVGFVGAGSVVWACLNLFRATRLSMTNISEEAALIRERMAAHRADGMTPG
jgi:hypothetical protein